MSTRGEASAATVSNVEIVCLKDKERHDYKGSFIIIINIKGASEDYRARFQG
jgi:hypothetical protein